MPHYYLRPQFRFGNAAVGIVEPASSVAELDESSPTAPVGFLAGESGGVQLRPHQLTLVHHCLQLESGPVPLRPALAEMIGGAGSRMPPRDRIRQEQEEQEQEEQEQQEQEQEPEQEHEEPDAGTLRSRVGVLADKAGSGKSFVLLGLVAAGRGRPPPPDPIVRSFSDDRVVVTARREEALLPLDASLLVVPHNLCAQWEGYIARWNAAPNARPLRHLSVNRSKHALALRTPGALDALDLIVVTATFYNSVVLAVARQGARLRRVMFDEADSLAIPCMARVDACFHWFVTASYRNLIFPFGDGSALPTTASALSSSSSATSNASNGGRHAQRTTGVRSSGFLKLLWSDLGHSPMTRAFAHALVLRNADSFVDASMLLPEPEVVRVRCRAPATLRVLAGVSGIDRAIVECLHAGDVASALQHVDPANRGTEANIISTLLAKIGRETRNVELHLGVVAQMSFASDELRSAERLRSERKRDELVRRAASIRERVISADMCCICYEGISNKTVAPCCSNAFCFACISRWLLQHQHQQAQQQQQASSRCPLCKEPLTTHDLMVVSLDAEAPSTTASASASAEQPIADGDSGSSSSSNIGSSALTSSDRSKLENLEAILRDRCGSAAAASAAAEGRPRSKVLVFSSFDNSFVQIARMLDGAQIRYRFLKGNHFTIAGIERGYRAGDLDVLLVNTANYGSGLNFENTTDVVMMHKFDTDIEHQVIGRAQRCGRQAPLKIWYLLHDDVETSSG